MKPSSWMDLDLISPPLARLLARDLCHRGRPLTVTDIAVRAGLSVQMVSWISRQKDFALVTCGDRDRYLRGCGITPRNQARHLRYLHQTQTKSWPMAHLFRLNGKQRTALAKIL